jgi:hypothetical protein
MKGTYRTIYYRSLSISPPTGKISAAAKQVSEGFQVFENAGFFASLRMTFFRNKAWQRPRGIRGAYRKICPIFPIPS